MKGLQQIEITGSLQQEHLRLFHDVAYELTSTLELETVLTTIMTKMAQFFGPERWSMLMIDEKAGELYYVIAVGEDSTSLKGLRVPLGSGIAGWVAATGNPMVVPDVTLDPQWLAFSREHADLGIQSIACLPVRSADRVLGVIQLMNSKFDLLSEYSLSFLRILCDFAAIAIQNARSMRLIHELSITDDCTGLFNARYLYEQLQEQLLPSHRPNFSLLFMDLDHFKNVNDTYGHLVGSRLLAEVGDLLRRQLGPDTMCFRYGGDEFVALLPGYDKMTAMEASKKLYHAMHAARFLESEGLALELRGSFGLATYPEDGDTIPTIIRAADTMMYEVKGSTRDNLAVAGLGLLFGEGSIELQVGEIAAESKREPSLLLRDASPEQADVVPQV